MRCPCRFAAFLLCAPSPLDEVVLGLGVVCAGVVVVVLVGGFAVPAAGGAPPADVGVAVLVAGAVDVGVVVAAGVVSVGGL